MTTVTLRPNATIDAFNVTLVSAASAHAAVNDNSDTSYIEKPNTVSGVTANLELDTVALPAGAVTRSITCRVRGRQAVLSQGSVSAFARTPAGGEFGTVLVGSSTLTDVVTTYSGVNSGASLSQADIDALQVRVSLAGFLSHQPRVNEVYVDLVYATQPTVTVTGPASPVTSSTSPSVTWAYTDGSDGGPQTRYQIRVFSAAQYGIAGFTPGSSPATVDTGEVASSATSAPVGPLTNGVTYRAYVRAAQTINGSSHWSEWQFIQFTMNVPGPVVQTVSVTPDNTNARHRIVVDRNTGGPAWSLLFVERSIDNGLTWVPVRGTAAGAFPPGNQWIGYDYEAPNGVPCIYRARASLGAIVGNWTTSTGSTWSSDDNWLKDVRNPARSRKVTVSQVPEQEWAITQGVFRPAGRPDPVVVSDVRQLAEASMQFECDSVGETGQVRELLSSGVLLLQLPATLGFDQAYLVAGTIRRVPAADELSTGWSYLDVDYVEVASPPDDGVIAFGTTYADMAAQYATYQLTIDTGRTYGSFI
jgi:hypothetical protein